MGMWVILIGNEEFDLSTIKIMRFKNKIGVIEYKEEFNVFYEEGSISFQYDYDERIKQDYSPEEIADLPYKNPHFILMKYSNMNLMKNVIGSIDFPKGIFIDCDGVDLGLEKIIEKFRLRDINK